MDNEVMFQTAFYNLLLSNDLAVAVSCFIKWYLASESGLSNSNAQYTGISSKRRIPYWSASLATIYVCG